MKKKIILILLSIVLLAALIYTGTFFTAEISKLQSEYNQTGIEEIKDIIKSYYAYMFIQMVYIIVLSRILMIIDACYISRYQTIIKGRSVIYWIIIVLMNVFLIAFGQLLYVDPNFYSGIVLMLILGTTSLRLLLIDNYFIQKPAQNLL